MKNLSVIVGGVDGNRFSVTVTGIIASASSESIRFAISEKFQTWCDPVGNVFACDVEHAFLFTVGSDVVSLDDEKSEENIAVLIRNLVGQLDRAFSLSLADQF
jgi:hypothetical protein